MINFFPRLLNKLNLLKFINLYKTFKINNNDIIIPVIRGTGFTNLYHTEKWMTDLLDKILKIKKGCFIDFGINIGQTLIKIKSIDPLYDYLGFEPNQSCIYYVENLISENKFQNTQIIPVAISDFCNLAVLNFLANDQFDSSASIIDNFRPKENIKLRKYVPVYNADIINPLLTNKKISIIKIDVEGSELEIVKELREKIDQHKPLIIIEILPVYKKDNIMRLNRQQELEKIVKEMDYQIFRINKLNDRYSGLTSMKEIGIHDDLSACDYLLIHRDDHIILKVVKDDIL